MRSVQATPESIGPARNQLAGQSHSGAEWATSPDSSSGRTVTAHSFVVEFDGGEGSADEVWIEFTEDNSATVLDAQDQRALRNAHSTKRALWRRADGEWNQVGGSEQARLTVDGVEVDRDGDPVGVPAYRAARSRDP